jgi:hypothetical protein
VERAALVLVITGGLGLAEFEEPVLLRLLAEPTGARPCDAELGCRGADGGAAAKQGGGLFEVACPQVARRPGEPAPWRGHEARLERAARCRRNGHGCRAT